MKLFFTLLVLFINSALGFSQEAEFYLKEHTFKFPKTKEGEIVEHVFTLKNTGNAPLLIHDYAVACHCTTISYPEYLILPNQTADIKLVFDTEGKYYHQDRIVELHTNTKRKKEKIRFKIFVIPREE